MAWVSLRPARAQVASLEYAIKATYLYKFAPFVTWPDAAFASQDSPVEICVLGAAPFAALVEDAVAGQRLGPRPFAVRTLRRADRDAGCHILYAAGSDAQAAHEALAATRGAPVLTVTDAAHTPANKGIIHFVVRENRVRFEIDNEAAAQNGLAISSRLLSLAIAVRPRT